MIEVKNLSKDFGACRAVDHLNFKIQKGEITGFLGLNGAGKSTTMNMLAGYLAASEGEITIDGKDILEEPDEAKRKMGYLPEIPPLYPDMTVMEYLNFIFELKAVRLPRREHLRDICRQAGVEAVGGRLIGNLSKGYRQRVGIAYAMVGNPPILILDEPTAGLDPRQIMDIRTLIGRLGKDRTVMLSTHILSEVQAVCERILVINGGRIVADGNADTLEEEFSGEKGVVAEIAGPRKEVEAALRRLQGVRRVKCQGEKEPGVYEYTVLAQGDMDLRKPIFALLSLNSWPLMSCRSAGRTLEELFLKLTGTGGVFPESQTRETDGGRRVS